MRLVFLGAPGVGKGTQAERISVKYGIPKISTGDLLRAGVDQQTVLGMEAKQFMNRGDLVPDKIVIGLVEEKLLTSECANGFILDGFPRTVPQADALAALLAGQGVSLDRVVYFMIPQEEVINRLNGRRSCSQCPAVYQMEFVPPKQEAICDECGSTLIQRSDDLKETVESRLSVYEEQTSPLIEYYRAEDVLVELNGAGFVESVQERLTALLPLS